MISLEGLLECQKELNSHCAGKPTYEELRDAIAAELGEFCQARKGDWCWWTRKGQKFVSESRDRQLEELADILCFLLTGLLMDIECHFEISDRWTNPTVYESHVGGVMRFCEALRYEAAIDHFAAMARSKGFTKEEIEEAYLAKVQVNKERWGVAREVKAS